MKEGESGHVKKRRKEGRRMETIGEGDERERWRGRTSGKKGEFFIE